MSHQEMMTRYRRQELIDGFGTEGQRRLGAARVAVVGTGGLGSPILTYLAAAGVGELRVFDSDAVEETNLNRQVLFTPADIGEAKVLRAGKHLARLNPDVRVRCHQVRIGPDSAPLLDGVDHLVDAVDNLETRAVLSRLAELSGVPVTFSAIESWRGAIHTYNPGDPLSPCFHCVFGEVSVPVPSPIPVLGAAVGAVGAMAAATVVRRIVLGDTGLDRAVARIDVDTCSARRVPMRPRAGCRCGRWARVGS